MSDDNKIIECGTVCDEADRWRSVYDLDVPNLGQGNSWFDETEAEFVDVNICRYEAELLFYYWFERKFWAEESESEVAS